MIKKINNYLHTPNWLFALLLLVLILRIPTLFEPYHYGDEMIYLTLGEGTRQGIPLYTGLYDNKPPLLYLTAALAGSLFWFKAILAVWHITTVYLFWKLTDTLFPKKESLQKIATFIFAVFTTIPLLEGNRANAELFMIGPVIGALLIIFTKPHNFKHLFFAGVLISIAALYKVPAMFDLPAILFLWLVSAKLNKQGLKKLLVKTGHILTGFLLPVFIVFAWYFVQGSFREFIEAAYLQNVGYLSTWRPMDVQKPFLVKNAPLILRAIILSAGLTILFIKRKAFSKNFIFLSAWLGFTLFAVTLSERPYPHYLIQSIPPAAILLSILFTRKTMEAMFTIIPLFFLALVPYYYNFWHYPTYSYYQRFVKLATGQVTRDNYLSSFDRNAPRDYKIAEHIKRNTKDDDRVFVWGYKATIYPLSRRLPPIKYTADYHIKEHLGYENIVSKLSEDPPEMIVVVPEAKHSAGMDIFLAQNYAFTKTIDDAVIWKLLSPSVRSINPL